MTIGTSMKAKKSRGAKKMTGDGAVLTKGAQAKARIISEAEGLFNRQGLDGASMRDIAAAAEMQPASVYYHFESKKELLWAVWENGGDQLADRVKSAIRDKPYPRHRMG